MLHRIHNLILGLPEFPTRLRLLTAIRQQLRNPIVEAHGLKWELDSREWSHRVIMTGGEPEPETMRLFRKLLRPGDVYLDVGAHIGFHALMARQMVGPQGRVLAIEPQPFNANKLLTNAAMNGFDNLVTIVGAAGEADGTALLRVQNETDRSQLTLRGSGKYDGVVSFESAVWRLDTVVFRHRIERIRLLKIDVEGYELSVLKGAERAIAMTDNIIFEVLPDAVSRDVMEIATLLRGQGFRLLTVNGDCWSASTPLPENNVWATRNGVTSPPAR